MDAITQKFAGALKILRTERNLTQEELAQRSGVDYKYLQKLEGQKPSSPTLSTLEKLATGLDIPLAELIQNIQAHDCPLAKMKEI
ncbi:MAG: helix-turn-helix domain-containing protein [Candidatus Adiutrix sp.]|jgi:transcriptional regulator with XRE-family HTH domain|nr:helix-turn-helix domain-containing protein [Candidatus Adiutrix sp.]